MRGRDEPLGGRVGARGGRRRLAGERSEPAEEVGRCGGAPARVGLLRDVDELQWDVRKVVEGVMGTMRRRRRQSTTSSSSPELRSVAAAVSRARKPSWVYKARERV